MYEVDATNESARLWEQLAEWEEYTTEMAELGDVPDTREVAS